MNGHTTAAMSSAQAGEANEEHAADFAAGIQTRPIVNNARLRRQQHINAGIATSIGLGGTLLAILLAMYVRPISWVHITIFLAAFIPIHLGVTIGFHRLFTHRSFEAVPALRAALVILGSMAGQGPAIFWVALHRMHHEYADIQGDPHSPNLGGNSGLARLRGILYAYVGWTVQHEVPNANHYARDVLRDPVVMTLSRYYFLWIALGLAIPAAIGAWVLGGWYGALEGFLWGGLMRMFASHNMIWWITSFAHVFGKHELDSGDCSTNNIWIALPTLGEGWHNNHHAFPNAATLDFRWWQLDISGLAIKTFAALGWARNLRRPAPQLLRARQLNSHRT
jgi:stearoyl-CoA desaturase (delta-9 desaturase)